MLNLSNMIELLDQNNGAIAKKEAEIYFGVNDSVMRKFIIKNENFFTKETNENGRVTYKINNKSNFELAKIRIVQAKNLMKVLRQNKKSEDNTNDIAKIKNVLDQLRILRDHYKMKG